MKKFNFMILFIFTTFYFNNGFAVTYKTIEEWEKCRDKAESSVSQLEVGTSGVEYAIKKKCGTPPVKELNTTTGSVGVSPYDLVRSKTWKKKFLGITKENYELLVERLAVSSPTELQGDWIVGQGNAPHSGGSDEAAIAINVNSGEVFAAILTEGKKYGFGFSSSLNNAPVYLQTWISEH